MSDYAQITYELRGEGGTIALVMMNRPEYRNAQSRVLREELDDAFKRASDDEAVRVIVLGGKGDHFSSGHDIGTPAEREDANRRPYPPGIRGQFRRAWDLNVDISLRWRDLPKPTIAMVQGYCIFGGWIIASSMDLIVAADDARFLPAHVQYFSVPWDLGVRKTKEILFQQRFMNAHEAHDLGFVNQVWPRAELEQRTMDLAASIAETDPWVTRVTKLAINQSQDIMGFTAAVRGAHQSFLVLQAGGGITGDQDPTQQRRLPGVAKALEKEQTKGG